MMSRFFSFCCLLLAASSAERSGVSLHNMHPTLGTSIGSVSLEVHLLAAESSLRIAPSTDDRHTPPVSQGELYVTLPCAADPTRLSTGSPEEPQQVCIDISMNTVYRLFCRPNSHQLMYLRVF
jgi:hypothetical protein